MESGGWGIGRKIGDVRGGRRMASEKKDGGWDTRRRRGMEWKMEI